MQVEKAEVVKETAAIMVNVANHKGILVTINEIFDIGDSKATGLYLTLPMPKKLLKTDVTRQDFPQRLVNALSGWCARVEDNTMQAAIPVVTADIQTREKVGGLGKMSLDTFKSWIIDRAWMHMTEEQKYQFCENLLSLNTFYTGGTNGVE